MNELLRSGLDRFRFHIFDLDDTLLNTSLAYTTAQKIALQKAFPSIAKQTLLGYINQLRWLSRQFGTGNTTE